ncbi:MAG: hypothetical protein JW839_14390 [Candidatus Lokiarchaeota archaeon]|nr:hypothetical protein [Candidatus Lokiarchaeota archaeon]
MSNYAAAYSPIGSEYNIVVRHDTHLIVECPPDKKLLVKRFMGSFIAILIVLGVYVGIMCAMLIPLGGIGGGMAPVIIIVPIIFIAVMGIVPASMYYTVSKFAKPFTIEFDKVANKMQMCTPNPYAAQGYYNRRNLYAGLGQYMTTAWDLDKVVIRACPAEEYTGQGAFSVKWAFKHKFIIVVTTIAWSYPIVFFASDRAELAQSLMGEIDLFLRGGPPPAVGWQGGGGEQPYRPGRAY